MSFKITKRPDGGVLCEYEGLFTPQVAEAGRAAVSGKDSKNLLKIPYVLVDHSKTTGVSHSSEDLIKLARKTKKMAFDFNPRLFVAVVAPDDLTFGLARVWFAYLEEEKRAGVFRTRTEAEGWISEKLRGPV